MRRTTAALLASIAMQCLAGCGREEPVAPPEPVERPAPPENAASRPAEARALTAAGKIVLAARREAEKKTPYEPGYHRIAYPGGDVPTGGVCTDVVVRAFRGAGLDLQSLVHEDMAANFARYPRLWGAAATDSNIDHRRVPNLMTFFERRGLWLSRETTSAHAAEWQPGDVVFWDLPGGLKHCGIVSDRRARSGLPLVIHNIGQAAEEDCLTRWPIIGHARYPKTTDAR